MYYTCIKDPIRIQESLRLGVIIPAIQVIKPGLRVVVVIPVAEGVDVGHMTGVPGNIVAAAVGDRKELAPGIVGVAGNHRAVEIVQPNDVPLRIVDEVVGNPVDADAVDGPLLIMHVEDVGVRSRTVLADLYPARGVVGCGVPVHRLARALAIRVVGVGDGLAVLCEPRQVSARPGHAHPVAVGERVADRVVGYACERRRWRRKRAWVGAAVGDWQGGFPP